jgi:hypothetical protein
MGATSPSNGEIQIFQYSPDSKTLGVSLQHTESDVVLLHDSSESAR